MTDKPSTSNNFALRSSEFTNNQDNTIETEDAPIKSEISPQTKDNENISNVESINSIEEAYEQVLNLKKTEEKKNKSSENTQQESCSSQNLTDSVNHENNTFLADKLNEKRNFIERNFKVKPSEYSKFPKKDLVEKIVSCNL